MKIILYILIYCLLFWFMLKFIQGANELSDYNDEENK